ncbi:glycosyltransferase [Rhodospirillaceae bacterium SYSU D60014]|uniref:glycosyltransferase n=1 Tax=Virgifigura deserti TaxID=2268457 RepID=UPI0013C523C8
MTTPVLSVITPCLNRRDMIAEAIESLLSVGRDLPTEHIIVDGGSTDGTRDVLMRYPHLRVIEDPGSGVYDALNRGIAAARGSLIGILNSDDLYDAEGLASALAAIQADSKAEYAVGNAVLFDRLASGEDRIITSLSPMGRPNQRAPYAPERLREAVTAPPLVNAHIFRRHLLDRVGAFDQHYPISADREFMLRLVLAGAVGCRVNQTVYRYRRHAGSLTMDRGGKRRRLTADEHVRMATAYLQHPMAARLPLRLWRAREATVRLWRDLRQADLGAIRRDSRALWRDDILWPVLALSIAPVELPRILARRIRFRAF